MVKQSNIGDDIKNIVQDALNSTDFKQLNKNITETVNRALDEVKKSSSQWQQQGKTRVSQKQKENLDQMDYTDYETVEVSDEAKAYYYEQQQKRSLRGRRRNKNLISKSPPGRISGIFMMIFGNLGLGVTIAAFLLAILLGGFGSNILTGSSMVLGPLALLCIGLVAKGSSLRRRFKRFKQYVSRLNGRSFCKISELAEPISKSSKYVVKDLRKMIEIAMFPRGRIDQTETYLFLDDDSYRAHLQLEEGRRLQAQKAKQEAEAQRQKEQMSPEMKAVADVIEEGRIMICEIQDANEEIESEEISQKLERLEIVITKIFQFIEKNPDEVQEIRKFMGYYLPTTLKLVRVYRDMDKEVIQGPNIISTKKEIEETLDTINHAFENLLDGFYEDTALDVSSDISVLETLLAQEGLTKKDFK